MIKQILIGTAAAGALFAGVVSARPDTFHFERSTLVNTTPDYVFAQVNDFHAWQAWSPWEKKDPNMKRTYSGPTAGVGSSYAWSGNGDVGSGRMTIESVKPAAKIAIKLEFLEPFAAENRATYTFAGVPGGTRVTWAMDGRSGFLSKAIGLFLDSETLIGPDFERGLAAMKVAAETAARNDARTAETSR
jgi:hypothetical protein